MFNSDIEYKKIRTDWEKSSKDYEPIITVPIDLKDKNTIKYQFGAGVTIHQRPLQ